MNDEGGESVRVTTGDNAVYDLIATRWEVDSSGKLSVFGGDDGETEVATFNGHTWVAIRLAKAEAE